MNIGELDLNLGDSICIYAKVLSGMDRGWMIYLSPSSESREEAVEVLRNRKPMWWWCCRMISPPRHLLIGFPGSVSSRHSELIGDVTQMEYIVGAVWTEEMINQLYTGGGRDPDARLTGKRPPSDFPVNAALLNYMFPDLLILSIIMIIFSASAAIVREPESRTLERLRISRLTALEFLCRDLPGADPGGHPFPVAGPADRHGTGVYPDPRNLWIHPSDLYPYCHLHDQFQPAGGCHVPLGKGGGHSSELSPCSC